MVAVVVDMVDKISRTDQSTKATLLPYAGVFFLQQILFLLCFSSIPEAVQVLLKVLSDMFTEVLHSHRKEQDPFSHCRSRFSFWETFPGGGMAFTCPSPPKSFQFSFYLNYFWKGPDYYMTYDEWNSAIKKLL